MHEDKYIWAIARVDRENVDAIPGDFEKLGYKVSVKIPCVKILKKKFKNKLHFQNIPLLFDYGFIGIPWNIANSREELQAIKEEVPGILGWLFLNTTEVSYRRRKLKEKFVLLILNFSSFAFVFVYQLPVQLAFFDTIQKKYSMLS